MLERGKVAYFQGQYVVFTGPFRFQIAQQVQQTENTIATTKVLYKQEFFNLNCWFLLHLLPFSLKQVCFSFIEVTRSEHQVILVGLHNNIS